MMEQGQHSQQHSSTLDTVKRIDGGGKGTR